MKFSEKPRKRVRIDSSKLNKTGVVKSSNAAADTELDASLLKVMGRHNETSLAEKILLCGANPNAFSTSSLILCEEPETAELLLKYGADIHASHDEAFWSAVKKCSIFKMKALLFAGAYVSESRLSRAYFDDNLYNILKDFFDTYIEAHNVLRYLNVQEKYFKFFYEDEEFLNWTNAEKTSSLSNFEMYNKLKEFAKKHTLQLEDILIHASQILELKNHEVKQDVSRILDL